MTPLKTVSPNTALFWCTGNKDFSRWILGDTIPNVPHPAPERGMEKGDQEVWGAKDQDSTLRPQMCWALERALLQYSPKSNSVYTEIPLMSMMGHLISVIVGVPSLSMLSGIQKTREVLISHNSRWYWHCSLSLMMLWSIIFQYSSGIQLWVDWRVNPSAIRSTNPGPCLCSPGHTIQCPASLSHSCSPSYSVLVSLVSRPKTLCPIFLLKIKNKNQKDFIVIGFT